MSGYKRTDPQIRFFRFVKKTPGCWLWKGAKLSGKYGKFSVKRGVWDYAHRVIWEFVHGIIPKGQYIAHSCDVPCCVKPNHLFACTPKENSSDMSYKGRQFKGSQIAQAKLNEMNVKAIRKSPDKNSVLARKYGVSDSAISMIRKKTTWKHVS